MCNITLRSVFVHTSKLRNMIHHLHFVQVSTQLQLPILPLQPQWLQSIRSAPQRRQLDDVLVLVHFHVLQKGPLPLNVEQIRQVEKSTIVYFGQCIAPCPHQTPSRSHASVAPPHRDSHMLVALRSSVCHSTTSLLLDMSVQYCSIKISLLINIRSLWKNTKMNIDRVKSHR